ncbi:MAG TPA: ADP-ribosyltransferase [Thermomicrobiales bacterium]|nr:ADP-ribosyltransferase [Thermomicrobiales bacterium]
MMHEPIRWVESLFDDWARRMSPVMLQAIHFYQRDEGAAELNAWYRRGIRPIDIDEVRTVSDLLDHALSEVKFDSDIVVYRGVGQRDRERFPDAVMEALAGAGGVVEDRGYLSTSLDRSVSISEFATDRGTVYEIHVPAGQYCGYLGHPLVSRPERLYQAEVLFPRGSLMVIRSVEYRRNGVARWITMELQ